MLQNVRDRKERGFTLIEIVLVLAIAGFILITVFYAVAGAQRSRRDTHRKGDLNSIFGAVETYNSINSRYPTTVEFGTGVFWGSNYIASLNLKDPSSGAMYAAGSGWPAAAVEGTVYYRLGLACDGSATAYGYSVKMGLETGEACRELK